MTAPLIKNKLLPQKRPVVLAILDGVGLAAPSKKNAVHLANTPTLDRLLGGPFISNVSRNSCWYANGYDMGTEVGHTRAGRSQ